MRYDRIAAKVSGSAYCGDSPLVCRKLGSRGPMVPVLGLGGQNIFSLGTYDEARDVFQAAMDAGVRYVDTAHDYQKSQERLGRIFKETDNLPEFFLATKSVQRERDGFLRELDENIELLGRAPDLLHVHAVAKGESQQIVKRGGALEAAIEARNRGLCKFVGITSHDDPQTCMEILSRTDQIDIVMVAISVADTRFLDGLVPMCRQRGVGVVAMKVMARGELIRPGGPGVQTAAQAIRFPLSQSGVAVAIAGFSFPQEVDELAESCRDFIPLSGAEQRDLVDGTALYSQDAWFYRGDIADWDGVQEVRPSPDWYERWP